MSERCCSPVSTLSENGSEDSYILVSTSHHSRSSSNEWDDMHEEFKHEEEHDEDRMEHEENHGEQPQHDQDHDILTPQRIIPIDVIPSLDHTIDIAQSDDEEESSQPCMESIYHCQFHEDDQEEPLRNLSMSQSLMEPSVASLHVCDDTEPELEPIVDMIDKAGNEVNEVNEIPPHVDDAPDYPAASASTMLCDDWEHKHDSTFPINDDLHYTLSSYDSIPHVYVDEYGYSHFQRHPNFCIGEQECWEAKHIHDEQFYYDPSTGTWLRGAPDNHDMDYEDSHYDTYDDPVDIPITTKSQIHNKITFKPMRTRNTRVRSNHTHIHKQQYQTSVQPSSASPPSTPSPPTTYTSLRRRHGRRSISPPPAEPEVIRPVRPGSHKRRGPNFYERIRGREQNYAYVATQHQHEQHLHDIATRTMKPSSVLDHIHGNNCTIRNCVHCRHVMRCHKDRKDTKNRHMDRDMGQKMESILDDAWE